MRVCTACYAAQGLVLLRTHLFVKSPTSISIFRAAVGF